MPLYKYLCIPTQGQFTIHFGRIALFTLLSRSRTVMCLYCHTQLDRYICTLCRGDLNPIFSGIQLSREKLPCVCVRALHSMQGNATLSLVAVVRVSILFPPVPTVYKHLSCGGCRSPCVHLTQGDTLWAMLQATFTLHCQRTSTGGNLAS